MDLTMAYRVFTLPVHSPGAAETELNGFLASHRVLSVDRRFVEEGERSLWSFCVNSVDAPGRLAVLLRGKWFLRAHPDGISVNMVYGHQNIHAARIAVTESLARRKRRVK
jgi:hypothetical protein